MAPPTALLLNDTSNAYHWGCYGTSTEIRYSLEELGYTVDPFGVAEIHNLATAPTSEAHFSDDSFHRVFMHDHEELIARFDKASVVVVNGEGTLHGLRSSAFNLLYLIKLAGRLGKQTHVVNTSIFPFSSGAFNEGAARLYRTALADATRIYVREPESHSLCQTSDITAELAFDCLPRFLSREDYAGLSHTGNSDTIILGGGFGLTPDILTDLLAALVDILTDFSLVYITGANGNPAKDDAPFVDMMCADGRVDVSHQEVTSFADWSNAIASAKAVISGRFHHTVAAACIGTPAIVFEAGTPKNAGLCSALNAPPPLPATPGAAADLRSRLLEALNEGGQVVDPALVTQLRERAALNFTGIEPA